MTKAKAKTRGFEVTDDDRELWWELARRYMRDRKNPAVQRWAWERAAPYINPRIAAAEKQQDNPKEFTIKVEDYRAKKEEFGAPLVEVFAKEKKEEVELESALLGLDDEDVH